MEWLGQAKINFHNSKTPISLQKLDGSSSTLREVCEESTPPCYLNPLLFNGHIQTMWTAKKSEGPPVYYKRKVFNSEDPEYEGTFAVDFVTSKYPEEDETLPPRTTYLSDKEFETLPSEDTRPMLVALHGLSGGSHEIYLRHCLAPLIDALEERRWEACVVNARGCANHKMTSGILFNARATWDCRQTVKWLRKTFPNRPLYGIGFSLGANIMTNYLGEEGSSSELKGAVVLSSPWNLDIGNAMLQSTWIGREIYSNAMAKNLQRLAEEQHPCLSQVPGLSFDRIRKCKYLHEIDREVQCPTWGYPTEGAYYRDSTSVDVLLDVRTPLFIINATDDPIASYKGLPYMEVEQTPYAVLCTTSLGGHLSWFEIGGGRWHPKPVANFLNKMAFEIDAKAPVESQVVGFGSEKKHSLFKPLRRKWAMGGNVEA